jgi:hypothetical protein
VSPLEQLGSALSAEGETHRQFPKPSDWSTCPLEQFGRSAFTLQVVLEIPRQRSSPDELIVTKSPSEQPES